MKHRREFSPETVDIRDVAWVAYRGPHSILTWGKHLSSVDQDKRRRSKEVAEQAEQNTYAKARVFTGMVPDLPPTVAALVDGIEGVSR